MIGFIICCFLQLLLYSSKIVFYCCCYIVIVIVIITENISLGNTLIITFSSALPHPPLSDSATKELLICLLLLRLLLTPQTFLRFSFQEFFTWQSSSDKGDFFVLFLRKDGLGSRKRVVKTKKISGNQSYSLSSFRWHSFQ